jgi:hypothetical protein
MLKPLGVSSFRQAPWYHHAHFFSSSAFRPRPSPVAEMNLVRTASCEELCCTWYVKIRSLLSIVSITMVVDTMKLSSVFSRTCTTRLISLRQHFGDTYLSYLLLGQVFIFDAATNHDCMSVMNQISSPSQTLRHPPFSCIELNLYPRCIVSPHNPFRCIDREKRVQNASLQSSTLYTTLRNNSGHPIRESMRLSVRSLLLGY